MSDVAEEEQAERPETASGRAAVRTFGDERSRLQRIALWSGVTVLLLGLVSLSRVSPIQVLVIGIQAGAVYSLVALGVALVYKATRVLNFAQGELGTVPAFAAFAFLVGGDIAADVQGQPSAGRLFVASVVAILVGVVLAVLVNVLVVRPLAEATPVVALVATVGVTLLLVAAEIIVFEARARRFPRYVEGSPCLGPETAEGASFGLCPLTVGAIRIPWHTIIVAAVLAAAAALLAAFFQTRRGTALLATAQEPFAAELQGVSVKGMATLAWAMAGAFGAVAGLLGGGNFNQITPGFMTATFLIPGFVGAILGGITSMPGAVLGGLLIGIAVTLANEIALQYDLTTVLPGPPQIAILLVLLLVLLLRPRGLLGKEA
ncbi:MAG: branched-chain amino acid ABC transporter permease [Nitriliruptorales bacterium]